MSVVGLPSNPSLPRTLPESLESVCLHHVPVGSDRVLLRYGRSMAGLSPARILDAVRAQNGSAYAVLDPQGRGFVAVGRLAGGCGETIADLTPEVLDFVDVGQATGPSLLFGGAFASHSSSTSSGPWKSWPKAEWWIPTTVLSFCSETDEQIVTASVELAAGTDCAAAAALLTSRLELPTPDSGMVGVAQRPRTVDDESRSEWCRRVSTLRTLCSNGDLEKVVTARAVRHDAPAGTRFWLGATFDSLRRSHPQGWIFAVVARGQAFVGATPERLVRQEASTIHTHALAGTAPRGFDARSDTALGQALLASSKDRREHQIVVDALREALATLGDDVRCGSTHLRRLTGLQHLETTLTAQVPPASFLTAVDRLHPTPALGGAPREAALAWLAAHEPLERGWFGGPIGWQEGDVAECLVAIRSALIHRDQAWTFAGAGIVSASDPEAEWDETTLKLQTAGDALRLGRPA